MPNESVHVSNREQYFDLFTSSHLIVSISLILPRSHPPPPAKKQTTQALTKIQIYEFLFIAICQIHFPDLMVICVPVKCALVRIKDYILWR